ncbi:hypothetical protein BCR34DRAFT_593142 [Clohesyomyces aquaticus]|uniref:Uncharacterized protein n=1 Tax=Clohesyomyces aquaticus TaxID=1231657 RepID=A0A1Y1YM73_9PLEO|nr:hypothetical protein BCR34DRAFT_593142 [Clohesyomyces aquaticus]
MASQRKHYILFILWTLFCIVSAGEFVQLDDDALDKGFLVWTGTRPINQGTKITDEDLSNLARDAHVDMTKDFEDKKSRLPPWAKKKLPHVMASLVGPAGDKIYFASSIKSLPAKVRLVDHMKDLGIVGTKVARKLEQCQGGVDITTKEGVKHVNKASCGEIMLSVLYFLDRTENADIGGSRIVAVAKEGDNIVVKNYCSKKDGQEDSYGCSEFLQELGINYTPAQVNGGTRQAVLAGLGSKGQISLCPASPIRAKL